MPPPAAAGIRPPRSAFVPGVQLASLSSAAVFTSGALFVYYCSAGAANMAAWQPTLVYGGLLGFLLFPNNIVYKVCHCVLPCTAAASVVLLAGFMNCYTLYIVRAHAGR